MVRENMVYSLYGKKQHGATFPGFSIKKGHAMIYLTYITFPSGKKETEYILKCGGSSYPYHVISSFGLKQMNFEPITILYGNNGSGKSTMLNLIADITKINRDSLYNTSVSYPAYVSICEADIQKRIPDKSRIITSDDVFDYMLEIRCLNEGIELKREDVCQEYLEAKYAPFQLESIADYDELKKTIKARGKTQTQFVKSELIGTVSEYSNGENAYRYFTGKIEENGLYILDEPENSLSPNRQLELKSFIENAARFFGCQFIISTHSPFLLAMERARIYDLDERPVTTKHWTELENVRIYRQFFLQNEDEFS
jgi:predicted ATPase